ncbi:MAG: hypothetical protein E7395_08640 [Ruminococcaceae bacterium]|nr:hypothetical protein [Oscillospiraceae bacterium]
MKKRLKGLACWWLVLVMLVSTLATPAMALPSNRIYIYAGTEPLKANDELYPYVREGVSEGTQLSSLVPLDDGVTLTGWNLWEFDNINSGYVIIEKLLTKDADWTLSAVDVEKYANGDYYVFEPLYAYSAAIDVYTGAEKLDMWENVDSDDVENRQIALDSALNEQDTLSDLATNNLIGWKLWENDSSRLISFELIEADKTLSEDDINSKSLLEPIYATAGVATNAIPLKDYGYPEWDLPIYLDLGTALNTQGDVMSALETSAGKLLGGWKLWRFCSSGNVGYVEPVDGISPKEVAKDYAVTYEDVTTIGNSDFDYFLIFEPLWTPKYKIDPQPTSDNPTVGVKELASDGTVLEDITDNSKVSYQWHEYGENTYRIVDDEPAGGEIRSGNRYSGSFDSESRTWAIDNSSSIDTCFPVKAGEIVCVTPVEGTVSGEITVKDYFGDDFTENDGIYTLTMAEDNDSFNLYVYEDNGADAGTGEFIIEIIRVDIGDAVAGQTTKTLTSGTDGQQYVCKAVIDDDGELVPLTSNPVKYSLTNSSEPTIKPTRPSGGGGGGVSIYKVSFETNGAEEEIDAQYLRRDKKVEKPDNPVKEGYVFDGWYIDEALTEAYDFDAWVKKNFTLYAKWTADNGDNGNATDNGTAKKWNPFIDVGIGDWFYDYVKYVFENDYMNGVSTKEFMPSQFVTRGMLVTILHRLDGEPKAENAATFEDVAADAYYAEAVAWAQEKAIVNGVTETEFAPETKITREQLTAILYRYAILKGYDVSVGESTNILSYEDFDEVSEYAIPALQYAVGAGIIKGRTETTLNPQESATRAEIATIIQRFVEANKN